MIHIDAHCDTGDDYLGSRFHHGAPFRRATEEGLLDPKRVIQIGIRGTTNDPDMWGFHTRSGMRVLAMEEFHDKGWRYAAEEARRVVGSGPTYLTFDIDSLDPSQAPGTGTPEAGGITALEALRLLRALRGIDFVGGDLVEVAPPFDVGTITSFNGASILFEILCPAGRGLAGAQGGEACHDFVFVGDVDEAQPDGDCFVATRLAMTRESEAGLGPGRRYSCSGDPAPMARLARPQRRLGR